MQIKGKNVKKRFGHNKAISQDSLARSQYPKANPQIPRPWDKSQGMVSLPMTQPRPPNVMSSRHFPLTSCLFRHTGR